MGWRSAEKVNRAYFREAYRTGEHGWGADVPSPHAVRFLKRLKRLGPGARLLDLGCGEGRHAIAAARLGFEVTGVDFESLALERARRFAESAGVTGIDFRKANVLGLPFRGAAFDVVLDYGCLHHQKKSDWRCYRSNLLRVLAPRGFYILSVFSPDFPLFRGSRRPWHIAQGSYRRFFTRRDLLGLFGREFEVLEMIEENGVRHGFWHVLFRRRDRIPGRDFYAAHPGLVARRLLGKILVRRIGRRTLAGRIVEAEAYSSDDPASHAYRGRTERNRALFGEVGRAYIYMAHGRYACLNVTARKGKPAGGVLIRALEPLEGIPAMRKSRGTGDVTRLTRGPGNLTRALRVGLALYGTDMTKDGPLYIAEGGPAPAGVAATPRIGVTAARERKWRFVLCSSPFVSGPKRA